MLCFPDDLVDSYYSQIININIYKYISKIKLVYSSIYIMRKYILNYAYIFFQMYIYKCLLNTLFSLHITTF